jgi:hypothetical protein
MDTVLKCDNGLRQPLQTTVFTLFRVKTNKTLLNNEFSKNK